MPPLTARPPSPLAAILQAIAGAPRTPSELAQDLGSTAAALDGMLRTLFAGGYVQEAAPDAGACACGPCALKSLCRNAPDGTPLVAAAPALNLLRLTPRGETYLARNS